MILELGKKLLKKNPIKKKVKLEILNYENNKKQY